MCTVVFAWQWWGDTPLVLVANRDELVSRASDPPLLLQPQPPLWGGRDRLAGGTWLAVDPRGRVCAVTNRHPGGRLSTRDAARRSRGELPAEVLCADGDSGAQGVLDGLEAGSFNPVNVLYLSATSAAWVGLDDEVGRRSASLAPGVHVLTEQDPDDPSSAKTTRLLRSAREVAASAFDPDALVDGWRDLLRSHARQGDGPQSAACIHEELFGTVSSSTVVIGAGRTGYEHAEGHPCVTAYHRVM